LISHPFHIATITGDSVIIREDNFGARIAFVDYDGKRVFENCKNNPPKTKTDEEEFVKKNAPRMVKGLKALDDYIKSIMH
jgi:aspartate aminotransferase